MEQGSALGAKILLVSLEALPNTRARCDGFLNGFSDAFAGSVRHWRVDGRYINADVAKWSKLVQENDVQLPGGK